MVNEYSFSDTEGPGIATAFFDDAHRLVAEDEWRLARDVPTHRFTRANAARGDAHEQFALAGWADRQFTHGNRTVAIVNGRGRRGQDL